MSLKGAFIFLLLSLATGIIAVYVFISSAIPVAEQVKVRGSEAGWYALMSNENTWEVVSGKKGGKRHFNYHPGKISYPTIFIKAEKSNDTVSIAMDIKASQRDSVRLYWHCEIPAGSSPWSRIKNYNRARQLKKDFSEVIRGFIEYAADTRHLYGIIIKDTVVKDTLIATLSKLELIKPPISLECSMISQLRQKVIQNGLTLMGFPMTLKMPAEENKFKIMVGFPVDKVPGPGSGLVLKKMIPGKLLTATIYGGPSAISMGHAQMRKYILDQNREEVALPYEVSIVNKCEEPDTSRWVTMLCYPVY